MPLYDFRCAEGHEFERFVKLEAFDDAQECSCGAPCQRLLSAPMFSVDSVGYSCPVTGDWVGSKREHSENLKKQGCRVLEPGETEAATSRRRSSDEALEKAVDITIEREIESMPSEKKETLYNELTRGGVTAEIERRTAQNA